MVEQIWVLACLSKQFMMMEVSATGRFSFRQVRQGCKVARNLATLHLYILRPPKGADCLRGM